MRHRKSGRRLGVPMHRRKAMMKQLVEALFLHGRIKTTLARAKETRSMAEKIVTLAKKGTLHNRRQAMAVIARKDVVNRLFDHIVEWYKERKGGYTRIIKIGNRVGDGASVAFLELVDWIPGDKLPGQLTKVEKSETGEEEGKGDKEKKEKAKKKKEEKKPKAEVKKKVKKVAKSAEQEKKISDRKAEKDKNKKERAAERDKVKKEKADKKAQSKSETKKVVKKAKKTVKKAKKKVTKKKA